MTDDEIAALRTLWCVPRDDVDEHEDDTYQGCQRALLRKALDEIERLRRIEDVAGELIDESTPTDVTGYDVAVCHFCARDTRRHERDCPWVGLAAALEEKTRG